MMQITPVVKQLLIINVIFFIGAQIVGPETYTYLAMFFFENPNFQYWQPISHMFMHGGIMHIAFNMFALYSFGSTLEYYWGGEKFLFFYISCGLGAALLHTGVNYYFFTEGFDVLMKSGISEPEIQAFLSSGNINYNPAVIDKSILESMFSAYNTPVVGASGAIYGLLVAFAFMAPNAELALMFIPVPIKAKYFVPGLLLIDLFLGVSGNSIFGGGTGIAHFAHIGGALVGFLMMWYWKKNDMNKHRWN